MNAGEGTAAIGPRSIAAFYKLEGNCSPPVNRILSGLKIGAPLASAIGVRKFLTRLRRSRVYTAGASASCARPTEPRREGRAEDADAIALPDWVMLNVQALASGADVVCGQAEIDPQDAALIPAHLHADDALEREYADLLDAIDDLLCPDPADPRPRHTEASGASLAMTAAAYLQAGG